MMLPGSAARTASLERHNDSDVRKKMPLKTIRVLNLLEAVRA